MEPIEQVFLHVRTVDGYRSAEVVATTEFVRTSDMVELVAWFSEHEEESILRFDRFQLFFHPLPSGDFALGMLHPAQRAFFSLLRTPKTFYVRILLVPPRTLLKKGNNPIALFEELRRNRKIPIVARPPDRLLPIVPSPAPALLDVPLLKSLSVDPGPVALAALHQACCDAICTFFRPAPEISSLSILNGLVNLLPIRFRTELTFASELHFSRHVPFRLVAAGGSRRSASRRSRLLGIPLLRLEDLRRYVVPPDSLVLDAWPRFVFHLLRSGEFAFFEHQLEAEYRKALASTEESEAWNVPWENLNERAVSWLKTMNEANVAGFEPDGLARTTPEALRCSATVEQLLPLIDSENDGFRRRPSIPSSTGNMCEPEKKATRSNFPPKTLAERTAHFPHLEDQFVRLDSAVARALFGDESVANEVASLWKEIRDGIPWEDRERLREEYVALVRSLLVQPPGEDQIRSVDRGVRLLELMLLFLDPDRQVRSERRP